MSAPADGPGALAWPGAWPGAWRGGWGAAEAVVGDVDAVAEPLPRPSARDLDEAGARRGEARRLYLRRRGVLRRLVGHRLGVAPEAVELGYDPRGAPAVLAPAGLFVSVSARGRLAAFALADRPVGIDVEPLHDPGPLDAALAPEERAALAAVPDPGRALALLRRWTAKEAYLKAIRTGLARDPAGLAVRPDGQGGFAVRDDRRAGDGAGDGAGARGRWWGPSIGGVATVVALSIADREPG